MEFDCNSAKLDNKQIQTPHLDEITDLCVSGACTVELMEGGLVSHHTITLLEFLRARMTATVRATRIRLITVSQVWD
jgi:hypothetical protein